MGRVVRWGQRASLRYTHLRTCKGDLGCATRVLGNGEHLCLLYGIKGEMGHHLVMGYGECHYLQRWEWSSWEQLDDRGRWRYTEEIPDGIMVVQDRVEDFFKDLDTVVSEISLRLVDVRLCEGFRLYVITFIM